MSAKAVMQRVGRHMHQLVVQVAGGSDRLESIGESLQEVLQDMKNGSGCAAEHHA